MEHIPAIIIIAIIAFAVLMSVISDYRERKRVHKSEQQIADELVPELDNLVARLEAMDAPMLEQELNSIKQEFYGTLATLKDENGEVINICPKCGDTLAVRHTAYYDRIFGCPNYPKCRYLVKVVDIDSKVFDSMKVS